MEDQTLKTGMEQDTPMNSESLNSGSSVVSGRREAKSGNKGKFILLGVVGLLVVIGGVVGAYVLLGGEDEKEETTTQETTVAEEIIFKIGSSFGECLGYCSSELIVTATNVTYIKRSTGSDMEDYPEKKYENIEITEQQWTELVATFDWEKFSSLEDRIGCPDCADGDAEWIEVIIGGDMKKVTFEYGSSLHEIQEFLDKLRAMEKLIVDEIKAEDSISVFLANPSTDADFNTLVSVERTTSGGNLYEEALNQLIDGATDEEKALGFFAPFTLTGTSLCGGPDFKFETPSATFEVQFCKDVEWVQNTDEPGSGFAGIDLAGRKRVIDSITKTLKFGIVETVIIKDKNGDCYGIDTGLNQECF